MSIARGAGAIPLETSATSDDTELDLWRTVLATFRDGLEAGRRVLSSEEEDSPASPWPPEPMPSGPMPPSLRDEARSLLADADALSIEIADAMREIGVGSRPRVGASFGRQGPRTDTRHARWSFNL